MKTLNRSLIGTAVLTLATVASSPAQAAFFATVCDDLACSGETTSLFRTMVRVTRSARWAESALRRLHSAIRCLSTRPRVSRCWGAQQVPNSTSLS